ncbi:MAG: hypothetical protein ACFFC7_00045 [Candidatus Hermodarchaeota archaeon]
MKEREVQETIHNIDKVTKAASALSEHLLDLVRSLSKLQRELEKTTSYQISKPTTSAEPSKQRELSGQKPVRVAKRAVTTTPNSQTTYSPSTEKFQEFSEPKTPSVTPMTLINLEKIFTAFKTYIQSVTSREEVSSRLERLGKSLEERAISPTRVFYDINKFRKQIDSYGWNESMKKQLIAKLEQWPRQLEGKIRA